jgi:Lipid A 3-O-deacylase (PagL)
MRWTTCALILLGVVMMLPLAATAEDGQKPQGMNFLKGTRTFQLYGTYAGASHADIPSGAVGAGYFVFDNLSLSLEACGYRATQSGFPSHDAWMYGVSGVMRHHLFHFDRSTIFADVSFGPVESTERIPAGGTYFNFVTRSGIGSTYQLKDNLHLIGGVRYFHLSNAKIEGRARNPSLNGVEGFVGLMWTF